MVLVLKHLEDQLQRCGFERNANEILYNGRTGEQMECSFMIGPTYYQRLKHMVEDKIHQEIVDQYMFTRQPEGSRDGGLRIGEMERDCFIAHGTPHMLKEKLVEGSDGFETNICEHSGLIAAVNPEKISTIVSVKIIHNLVRFRFPYACKLLFQELQSMGIAARIIT